MGDVKNISVSAKAVKVSEAFAGLPPIGTGVTWSEEATNEVQLLSVSGTPTGGAFTLAFKGEPTVALAYDAAASAVQAALTALPTIGAGNVTVTGDAGGPYTVTFSAGMAEAGQPLLRVNSGGLTGGTSPSAAVSRVTPGGGGWMSMPFITKGGIEIEPDIEVKKVEAFMHNSPVAQRYLKTGWKSVSMALLESDETALLLASSTATESGDGETTPITVSFGGNKEACQYALAVETDLGVWYFPCCEGQLGDKLVFENDNETAIAATYELFPDSKGDTGEFVRFLKA